MLVPILSILFVGHESHNRKFGSNDQKFGSGNVVLYKKNKIKIWESNLKKKTKDLI